MEKSVAQPRTGAAIQSPKVVERRSRVRESLVETGARLFAEKGVEPVSVEEIIADVGISRRTFYGFFANKYELVASVLNPVLEAGVEDLQSLAAGPAAGAIPGIAQFYLRQWAEHRDALQIISSVDMAILEYIEPRHTAFGKIMKTVLERAQNAGLLRNGRADYTFKVISRTAIPLLKVYGDHPDMAAVYTESMLALLVKSRNAANE